MSAVARGLADRREVARTRWSSLQLRWRSRAVVAGQIGPAAVFITACFLIPIGFFLVYSFWQLHDYQVVPRWTTSNYRSAVTSGIFRHAMVNTIIISALTAIGTTVIACAFTSVLRFRLRRWQNHILMLVLVALFSGYIVRIFAWQTLLGVHGVINTVLLNLGVIHQPLGFLLFTRFATILVLCNFLIPLAMLPCHAALQNVSDAHVDAARDLGCGPWRTYWRVVVPMAWPGFFLALALSSIIASGDYLTPEQVGGPSGTMIGQNIADIFLNQFNWPQGAALAFVTLAAVLVSVGALRFLSGRVVR